MLHPADFFDLNDGIAAQFFAGCDFVWQALPRLEQQIMMLTGGKVVIQGEVMPGAHIGDRAIYIAAGARIEPGAFVMGPAYIGEGVTIRHGAFVRQNVVMLLGSTLGHASEAKHSLFLPQASAPHFNYVGDSILGHRINLGAGTKLSNVTLVSEKDALTGQRPTIKLSIEGEDFDTGLAKLGAILGDDAQTGCNSVMNPGCLIGRNTLVYANVSLRKGYYPPHSIIKLQQKNEIVTRR
jgi:NDP-sugar pyrophosphorylase family protein